MKNRGRLTGDDIFFVSRQQSFEDSHINSRLCKPRGCCRQLGLEDTRLRLSLLLNAPQLIGTSGESDLQLLATMSDSRLDGIHIGL